MDLATHRKGKASPFSFFRRLIKIDAIMSNVFLDLTGTVFGRLTVLSFYGRKGHETLWSCRCSCGVTKVISKNSLKQGTKSCGCLHNEITSKRCLDDLTGQRFGKWTVLIRDISKGKYTSWFCKCDCGTEKSVRGQSLKNGDSQSCGCYRRYTDKNRPLIDMVGLVFGRLTVIKRVNKDQERSRWLCKCSCGNEKIVNGASLRIGETRSCGCLLKEIMASKVGELNPWWKGGKHKTKNGYTLIKMPHHPNANQNGYVREHIYIMALKIGRPLLDEETVHHKNGNRSDNRIENLELWASNHGGGQRVSDLVPYWRKMLALYEGYELQFKNE